MYYDFNTKVNVNLGYFAVSCDSNKIVFQS